jgi:peptidoglycan/LPS O-acetylase OafA/YrhL
MFPASQPSAAPWKAAGHIPSLDGLRGFAVLAVILGHGQRFLPLSPPAVWRPVHVLLVLGWCGVELFFVLSGFLITRLLLRDKEQGRPGRVLGSFYARRALRIFPLYYVTLAVIIGLRRLGHIDIGPPPGDSWWYWSYLQNWYNARGHIPPGVGHFWSLAIEEQFYLVWPIAVLLLSRRTLGYVCIFVIAVTATIRLVAAYYLDLGPLWLYHATIAHTDGLAMGALLAVLEANRFRQATVAQAVGCVCLGGLAVVVLAVCTGSTAMWQSNTPFSMSAPAAFSLLFFGCLLYVVQRPTAPVTRLLQSRIPREMGRLSYALYVFHYPIAWALETNVVQRALGVSGACSDISCSPRAALILLPTFVLTSTAMAALSGRFLERPFLALKSRL